MITVPDEMVHYKLSHLDLHCLHRYLYWSKELEGLKHIILHINLMAPDKAVFSVEKY